MCELKRILRLTLISCLLFSSNLAYSGVKEDPILKVDYGPSTAFKTGTVGKINIPLDELTNAKIAVLDGLVIIFDDGSNLSMETLTDKAMGFEGVDMRTWPKYLLGIQSAGSEPEGYKSDLEQSKKHIIDTEISAYEIRTFPTKQGIGYWAIGPKKSVIVFTSSVIEDQVALLFAENMDEQQIKKIIINGALK
ncbi:hypothetical protein ACMXYV_07565 [Neptuniibacter sp. SY11_33]|uniref:hypothetical protein n=1 Tax=Neptuniibacter sp. SY11_33 TaxID=3398215 RepID=UPI0039F4E0E0